MEKTKNKKKTILKYSLIFSLIVTVGITSGVVIKRYMGEPELDYTGFNPDNYKGKGKELLEEYKRNPNKEFTPVEKVNIALERYRQCENCYSIGVGLASTIVDQTIRNAQIKHGETYFEESISNSSFVAIANRSFQEGLDKGIDIYKGESDGAERGIYEEKDKVSYEKNEDYKTDWGKTLDEMFIYILSEKTIITDKTEVNKLENGNIQIKLELDPDIATYYYKIQMKTISKLDKYPSFEFVRHTYTLSEDMTLIHAKMDEKYQATMGFPATIHGVIDYYYHNNEFLKIPNLDEQIDYSLKGENEYE